MDKVIKLKDIEYTWSQYEEIEEPIVVERENKSDVVILSLKEYKEKLMNNIDKMLFSQLTLILLREEMNSIYYNMQKHRLQLMLKMMIR